MRHDDAGVAECRSQLARGRSLDYPTTHMLPKAAVGIGLLVCAMLTFGCDSQECEGACDGSVTDADDGGTDGGDVGDEGVADGGDAGCGRAAGCGVCECPGVSVGVRFAEVTVGGYHSCGVRESDSEVLCWGINDGSRHDFGQARPPRNLELVSVAAGTYHTCGLRRSDRTAICWGINDGSARDYGQAAPPAAVAFRSLAAGAWNTCGIREADGEVLCWGAGTTIFSFAGSPTDWIRALHRGQSMPPTGVAMTAIDAGTYHACGIVEATGEVRCWGEASPYFDPVGETTPPLGAFSVVSAGLSHSCGARDPGGVAVCWGEQGDAIAVSLTDVAVGAGFSCGVRADDGTLVCWGEAPYGLASPPSGVRFQRVSAAGHAQHACGVRADGFVHCWGAGPDDNIDDGLSFESYRLSCGIAEGGAVYCEPSELAPPAGLALRKLSYRQCGLRASDARIECWGEFDPGLPDIAFNDLSVSPTSDRACAIRASDDTVVCTVGLTPPRDATFSSVSVGYLHACGLRMDGEAECWGSESGSGETVPPSGIVFTQVEAGAFQSCGRRASDGGLECWPNGDAPEGLVLSSLAMGNEFGCGTTASDGTMRCWGSDMHGQAVEAVGSRLAPPRNVAFVSVSAGSQGICGVRASDHYVECWGSGVDEPPNGEIVDYGQSTPPRI